MAAWVVRAGGLGENEHWNIEHGRATIGWSEIGDLSGCQSRDDVRALVEAAYPEASQGRQTNHTGQLWAFRNSIKVGDLIVLPLKTKPGYIQFGRATGSYAYDPSQPDKSRRHHLPVKWASEPIAKTVLSEDLVYTLNGSMTVFQATRNGAAERLGAVAAGATDTGATPEANATTTQAPAPDSSLDVTDPETAPTIEAIRDRVRTHVAERFKEHQLTHLVADILTVLGFRCEVSPPGADGGVDIVGGMGPLGLDAPTLIVEVKSEPSAIDVKVVRGLHSAMVQHTADQALLVAWGGVTKPARKEFQRDRTMLRVWDAEQLLDQLFATYERLPAATRAQIPLRQVWVLEDDA
ncbi:restriction endonuclease [Parenemella sanctibonifatiensis]|uniref:Restriction endonuclease n=1 Tax=Parenemella sanctibonifatiensis TaxID=2016505 RepID=A0A255EQP6_9ACTN|nr:restriction endonuclease [Parenemella sanctibonifatiensis]OYN90443.1 restriction endonuclease [Parenemella sanctibonifatiensis]